MIYKTIYPVFINKNTCKFCVWAPKAKNMHLMIGEHDRYKMDQEKFGYWNKTLNHIKSGTLYKYQIDEKGSYPDPASLSQPDGVHGFSEVIDLKDFKWSDSNWNNIPFREMIQYELHTGTFSRQSDFRGIISKMDHFKKLGINTIEIMPVSRFSGTRNWGYDGAYPFAVQNSYGGAKELMKLVDECHKNNIAVILDVVYNHFGPEGNYVGNFGYYFSGKYSTPWGKSINFDGQYSDGVRNYIIQNALMWCRDFHMDGLRLDAVHAIFDFSAKHIMLELSEKLNELSRQTGRIRYLIAESNLNDVRYISPAAKGGYGLHAQWSDDFHHAVHALTTNEKRGYYMDFGEPAQLSKAIKDAFVYDGKYSPFRKKTYGNSTKDNTGEQFVIFNQNHDQIGNRLLGERLISLTDYETAKIITGIMFVAPYVPMLFMGEEYGETNPFYYFVSHLDPKLNKLVRKGRKKEFKDFYKDISKAKNPDAQSTFEDSKLSWNIKNETKKNAMLGYYRKLIEIRKSNPVLRNPDKNNLDIKEQGKMLIMERWKDPFRIFVVINFEEKNKMVTIPSKRNGSLIKILDSSDFQWNGPGGISPVSVEAGDKISIKNKSIVIYER